MGTRKSDAAKVYKAAEEWVARALRADDSLFTPGKPIWTRQWLGEIHERFLDRPDDSNDSFINKLERQLANSPADVYQLMAEALYVYFLIVSTSDSTDEVQQIATILSWSPQPVDIPPELVAGLTPGIANPGVGFHAYRPFQVGSLIEFAERLKEQPSATRLHLLNDPWAFKEFLMAMKFRSLLLRGKQNTPSTQRQALLHLVHPETFEPIVSLEHKKRIAEAFEDRVENPPADLDRKLQRSPRCRSKPATERRTSVFTDPTIRAKWDAWLQTQPSGMTLSEAPRITSIAKSWTAPRTTTRLPLVKKSRRHARQCSPGQTIGPHALSVVWSAAITILYIVCNWPGSEIGLMLRPMLPKRRWKQFGSGAMRLCQSGCVASAACCPSQSLTAQGRA